MMPGQDLGAIIPSALLDLISLLPASHDYVGPSVDVDMLLSLLVELELPEPPEPVPEFQRPAQPVRQNNEIANLPSASDIFRLRQQMNTKNKK
jgi:uncharacterized protein YukJ